MNDTAGTPLALDLLLTLAIGGLAIGAVAFATVCCCRHPGGQRGAWQAAILALVLLLGMELTGIGGVLIQLGSQFLAASPNTPAPVIATSNEPVLGANRSLAPSSPFALASPTQLPDLVEFETGVAVVPEVERQPESLATHGHSLPASTATNDSWTARLPRLLAAAWLVGSLLVGLRVAGGHLLLQLFRWRHAEVRQQALCQQLQAIARRLQYRGHVRLVEAAGLSSPIAFGVIRPVIGLPPGFTEEFSPDEQRAMLAHELAHLARRDPAWHLLADLLVCCLWWHPVAWWMRNRLQATSEAVADEASSLLENGPETLASCLVRLARQANRRPSPAWLGVKGNGFRSSLGRRVMRLMNLSRNHSPQRGQVRWGLFLVLGPAALVAVALVTTAWAHAQPTQKGETTMALFANSWRHSLAGIVVVAALGPSTDLVAQEERKEQDRPAAERREGDRPAERREGDRPAAERRPEGGRAAPQVPERKRIEDQLAELQRALARASEAGQRDQQEGIERQIQGLRRRLEALARQVDRPEGAPREGAPRDGERRPEGAPRDGERRPEGAPRDGERRPEGAPRDGERRPGAPIGDGRGPNVRRPDVPGPDRFAPDRPIGEGRGPDARGPEGRGPDFRGEGFGPPQMAEMMRAMQELREEIQRLRAEVGELRAKVQLGAERDRPRP